VVNIAKKRRKTTGGDIISSLNSKPSACIRAAFPHTLPVLTGYLALGAGFGILLADKGYGLQWALFMSVAMFAGSMQFVGAGLLAAPFAPAQTALMTFMVNARHLFYGLPMIERWKGSGRRKPYQIFALTDETFSLLVSVETPPDLEPRAFEFWMAALNHSYWIAGSAAGALIARAIPFDPAGIDFSMTALFVVIFLEQWRGGKGRLPAAAGLGCALICLIAFGDRWFLLPSMAVILAVLLAVRPVLEKCEESAEDRS